MTDQGTMIWIGASGKEYTYWVYPLPTGLSAKQDGNYIYAKKVEGLWTPVYIGQGDLGDRTDIDKHHQSHCLKSKGATHVHAHKNGREEDRRAEETDLLDAHPEAYQPKGCNEKKGG